MKQYKLGILSAGNIAGVMAETVSQMDGELVPYAIAARDKKRAEEMARKNGFLKSYGSYEELVTDPDVDLVYIASPHSHHYKHTKLCLNHGKHVLCEKAFTANAAQAREIIELAKAKKLFLGEAVWTRFMPFLKPLRDLIRQGTIGEVKAVLCGFGQELSHVNRMTSPALAGGALLDLGIYPLTFATLVLGTEIESITGSALLSAQGVDEQNSFTVKYKGGKTASLSSCMTAWMPNDGIICGEKGYLRLHDFWMCQRITVCVRGEKPQVVDCPFEISGYEYEVRAALKALSEGRLCCEEMPWEETLRLMEVMDGLRASWGVRYPFE